ncbi:Transcriptional regulator LsrR [Aquimixticola soesokkakensis]|uniref:Transcriptional regulator LsrR n=1 Tax=Aquimixticola soesokkakensis TaxID=1519096 RepID=A0A1Y5RSA8_9RHOB|nr:sugar-binding transcriptional regulator [Aquimixticola soesokkakensis]SLN21425.1 Transcriptional regulator LsrR [Aquimixticola soesokkakensis]
MESSKRLDDAARAAWLAHIGGKTQEEIATILGVSRQTAQRLVSQAVQAGLVKVRIDHPIARCLGLAEDLKDQFGLRVCEVVPTLPDTSSSAGVAEATGNMIETWLTRDTAAIIALGTGRTLRAAIAHLPAIDCAQHRIVSLTGNIAPDGSTAFYNVLFSISEKVTAKTYPMPMPVVAASSAERDLLLAQKTIANTRALGLRADVAFVGVGEMAPGAPLVRDGFIGADEAERLVEAGAVGEILGWTFDASGALIQDLSNARVASTLPQATDSTLVLGAAKGLSKARGIHAAILGGLINGLITDEETAATLLA